MSTEAQANRLYEDGLAAFRAGDNQRCITLTNKSLELARSLNDDQLIGQALTGLCRSALRDKDQTRLGQYSNELTTLYKKTNDLWWRVIIAHMNAELFRMNGDYENAIRLYDESLELNERLGNENMVATECFNKSLAALGGNDTIVARDLIRRHFEIRLQKDKADPDPTGLIALSLLLLTEGLHTAAFEAACVCRRQFQERGNVPDPADEEPLRLVEMKCKQILPGTDAEKISTKSAHLSCLDLVRKHLDLPD